MLLADIGASPPVLLSLAEHNETQRTEQVLRRLQRGEDVALVSDAGTPLVSDPGYELVRAAHQCGIPVVPIPGPSAVMAALSVSPLPVERFFFEGFLPAKAVPRCARLAELAGLEVSLVCFESARRLAQTLADVVATMGGTRPVFLAKELTKLHEQLVSATAAELAERALTDPALTLGEYVLVIGAAPGPRALTEDGRRLVRALCEELPLTQAARLGAKALQLPKSVVYEYALSLKPRKDEGG